MLGSKIPLRINKRTEIGTKHLMNDLKFSGSPSLASNDTAMIPAADPKGVHPPPNTPAKTTINHR